LPARDGEEIAALNFSGGTTGAPKAAMLRHRNLLTVVDQAIAGFGIDRDARFLNVRPLWPIAQVILMSHLFAGATVALARFDPASLAGRLEETAAARISLVPTQLVRWIEHIEAGDPRLRRLEAIYVGGSRLPRPIFQRALALLGPKIGVLYGLTEAPISCYLAPGASDSDGALETVGRPLPGCEVTLASDTNEVLIRGRHVMAGYWRDEAATRAALREGWLHTGDIGRFDRAGNLAIVSRLKDVIRSGASSIIPQEVEDAIALHPAVQEVAVIGVPDLEWGEAVTAFVVLKPGMTVSERELVDHCRERIASYKKPRAVRFVANLPRSHYGKVVRAQLLAMRES
jgi:acyl-CoA synthetase (AMP-forming)/AMP-acid ligase II